MIYLTCSIHHVLFPSVRDRILEQARDGMVSIRQVVYELSRANIPESVVVYEIADLVGARVLETFEWEGKPTIRLK